MLQRHLTAPPPSWHSLAIAEAVAAVHSDRERGLSSEDARARLLQLGPNALPAPTARSPIAVFAGQFRSPLIYLLLAAAAIALGLGHASDAVVSA
jgi:Ca2+-transporting ATPase